MVRLRNYDGPIEQQVKRPSTSMNMNESQPNDRQAFGVPQNVDMVRNNSATTSNYYNRQNPNLSSQLVNNSNFAGIKESYELPKFDGTTDQWPLFISKFENTAHSFTADVNLIRLQNCLRGAARTAVEDLLTMPNNIAIIIDTLKNFFGRPEFIINSLLDKIRKETKPRGDNFDASQKKIMVQQI